MNENEYKYDDLTEVKYIGPKLQSWLRERMKVKTYQDLADLSFEEIQTQLASDRKSVARSKIELWFEEARELAVKSKEESEASEAAREPGESGTDNQPNPPKKTGDWKEYASFMVYFEAREINGQQEKRITTSHLEEDKSEVWPQLTVEHLNWMLDQAGEGPVSQKVEEESSKPEEEQVVGEARVEVTQIQLFQPPDDNKSLVTSNGTIASQELSAGEPFALEVSFSVGGEGAPPLAKKRVNYYIRAIADEVVTKVGTDLGVTEPETFVEGTFDYSIRMPEATLVPGVHRLWAMVEVQAPNAVPNFLEGPSVKVV